jgi:hypothetical protein
MQAKLSETKASKRNHSMQINLSADMIRVIDRALTICPEMFESGEVSILDAQDFFYDLVEQIGYGVIIKK